MEHKSANWVVIPASVILAYGVIKLNPAFASLKGPDVRFILGGALFLGFLLGSWIDGKRLP